MRREIVVFKDIATLLRGLKTVTPKHPHFQIHRFEDAPETQVNETTIFRSNTYVVILLLDGEADYKIGLHDYHMGPGSLYFLGPQHLRYYKRNENNWKGFVCIFTDEFTTNTKLPNHFNDYPFYSLKGNQKFQLEGKLLQKFTQLITQLYHYFEVSALENCWHQLHIILNESRKLHRELYEESEVKPGTQLVIDFNSALEKHFYDVATNKAEYIFSVNDFAQILHIHPNHLSNTLKKYTGETAGQLIKKRTVLEAKSLLLSTEMSVSQVAYFLKFNDTSYFTKFFKGAEGSTPKEFQRSNKR
ncbi:helix-turn-helix transcriptional regulator [Aquimarina gracilis]|uniref:Helix-turn-helix transcriptional regulator n=1 Tax=Aquimarina gracilis TaxID=874422 RepID=A0ABU5ZRW7_9FLAO|nr:helix-turn-helix transcriptional regulator [Aquimarina gracilis]MEB3344802.1 helix-turn-helix transcriptional regulator [Aquimarina gracilis]